MTGDGTSWRVELPWAAPPMRDNDRKHWAAKARQTRDTRDLALLLARSVKLPQRLARASICLHWQPGTNRRRDPLSVTPSLKPLVDGLVDYGLIADDDTKHVSLSCCIHDWQRNVPAGCWLTITDLSERAA